MNIAPLLKRYFASPERRNVTILSVLLVILIIIAAKKFMAETDEVPPGSLRVLICEGCGARITKRIVDLHDKPVLCEKCGKPMRPGYKCTECDYEFPVLPMELKARRGHTMELLKEGVNRTRCPNCGSTATLPISVRSYKKKAK